MANKPKRARRWKGWAVIYKGMVVDAHACEVEMLDRWALIKNAAIRPVLILEQPKGRRRK